MDEVLGAMRIAYVIVTILTAFAMLLWLGGWLVVLPLVAGLLGPVVVYVIVCVFAIWQGSFGR